jgi:hypothetical protein
MIASFIENGDGEVDQHFWAQANQNGSNDADQSKAYSIPLSSTKCYVWWI